MEAELLGRRGQDPRRRLLGGIGEHDPPEVLGRDRSCRDHRLREEVEERAPVVRSHQDQREVPDLAGLDQRRALEDLVHGAEPAGQRDEGVRVLDQHDLADEKVAELEEAVDVRVRLLLFRQHDVAADRGAPGVLGTPVRRLHDPGAAARHDGEPGEREPAAELAAERVVGVALGKAGGAEDRDAGADEVEPAEAADELEEDREDAADLGEPGMRAGEELPLLRVARRLAPLGIGRQGRPRAGILRCVRHGAESSPTNRSVDPAPRRGRRLPNLPALALSLSPSTEDPTISGNQMAAIQPVFLLSDSQLLFWRDGEPEFYELFLAAMDGIGIRRCRHVPERPTSEDLAWVDAADLLLFAGGDVRRGWDSFQANGLPEKIFARYYAGALLVGISAGAVQLGLKGLDEGSDRLFDTFRVVPFVLDAHGEPDWHRLYRTVPRAGEHVKGIGIPTGGGLIYHPDYSLEPIRHP